MFRRRLKINEIAVVTLDKKAHLYKGFQYYLSKNYLYIQSEKRIVAIFPRTNIFQIDNLDIKP